MGTEIFLTVFRPVERKYILPSMYQVPGTFFGDQKDNEFTNLVHSITDRDVIEVYILFKSALAVKIEDRSDKIRL